MIRAYFFDLDDTLVDTYGQLVSQAHLDAAEAMTRAGFPYSPEETYHIRLRLHQQYPRDSMEKRLVVEFGKVITEAIQNASYQAFFQRSIPKDFVPFPATIPLLRQLKAQDVTLFLISSGVASTQEEKVRILGIEPFFEKILYLSSSESQCKQEGFSQLMQQYSFQPNEVICVGNRLDSEIQAGNRLGLLTIYLKHGEFVQLRPQDPSEVPSLEIDHLEALPEKLHAFKKKVK
ncbi:MAG: HAD hydrolase-like protein [Planctomycetota bacterium]|mgnify:CR=1 FL=1